METIWESFNYGLEINDSGVAVGVSFLNYFYPFNTVPVMWVNGEATVLPTLGGLSNGAMSINNAGVIAGNSEDLDGLSHVVVWIDGQIVDLGFLPGTNGDTSAEDINEAGVLVGYTTIEFRNYAFVWDGVQMSVLPEYPESKGAMAFALNDNGVVGGTSTVNEFDPGFAALWDSTDGFRLINLEVGSDFRSGTVHALSNTGLAVGSGFLVDNDSFLFPDAFISTDGSPIVALDTLLPPRSYWKLEWAYDVNDAGQIVGVGINKREQAEQGFFLAPIHPTLTLAQPSPGKAGQRNTLTLSGATPGARIYFVYGTTGGGAVVPGCDLQEAAIQIDTPKTIGFAIANASGVATLSANVPLSARNAGDILIQAVDRDRCVQSQLVVEVFE